MNYVFHCLIALFALGIYIPVKIIAQAPQKPAFTFTINKELKPCWLYDARGAQKIEIVHDLSPCRIFLKVGSKRLSIDSNITQYNYTMSADQKSLFLVNNRTETLDTIPNPRTADVRVEFVFRNNADEEVDAIGQCSFGQSKQFIRCDNDNSGTEPDDTFPKDSFYFIPGFRQELEYARKATIFEMTESEECCPGTAELVYDLKAQCLIVSCDLEDCICKTCRDSLYRYKGVSGAVNHAKDWWCGDCDKSKDKNQCCACKRKYRCAYRHNALHNFHPRVGDAVRIKTKGMHPYHDMMELNIDFFDRNKDGRAGFQAQLDRLSKQPDPPKSATGQSEASAGQPLTKNTVVKYKLDTIIPAFKREMTLFYQQKYNASQMTIGFLIQCIAYIQGNIIKHFEIPAPTPELMTEKLNQWFDDMQLSKEEKERYRAMLKDGLEYYKKILDYRVGNAWLFQVKNSDVTQLGFTWYRNGQRISSNPQTFEFFNRGGFTIDYSAGLAINGLVNHEFTGIGFDTVDNSGGSPVTVTRYRVERKKGDNLSIGPILLAHAYYRYPIWNRFKIGASTGFITNASDELSLNFLFGSSLLFGSEERFNLTGGGIIGKVARLREGLEEGVTVLNAPLANESAEIVTRKIYRCKWFIGITYNLGK